MANTLGIGSGLGSSLGLFSNLTKPRKPTGQPTAPPRVNPGVGQAGAALAPKPKPPAAVNHGLAGIGTAGSAILGRPGGGGAHAGPGAGALTTQPAAPAAPPPSAPNPADQFNIGLVPADEQAKADAQATYDAATAGYQQAIQNAAMRYGDPTIMQQWGLGTTVNPNSVLAQAALKAQLAQQASGNARESAGTFFSSLHDNDLTNIAGAQQRAQLAGYQSYQNALGNYNTKMTDALKTMQNAIDAANLDERQNAINNLPDASTAGGDFQGNATTNVTSKVPTSAPKGGGGGKASTVKNPKTPTTKSKLPSVGSKGAPKANTPKAPTAVKTGVKKISGGKPRG